MTKNGQKTEETVWVRNYETRERIIKAKGGDTSDPVAYKKAYDEFIEMGKLDEKYEKLRDIPIPTEYSWIWEHFLNIWRGCEYDFNGNPKFTFQTLNDYVECMKVPLSVEDKKELLKIKAWAMNAISELEEK